MKIEDPLPDFLTTPCTTSKEFENECASLITTNRITNLQPTQLKRLRQITIHWSPSWNKFKSQSTWNWRNSQPKESWERNRRDLNINRWGDTIEDVVLMKHNDCTIDTKQKCDNHVVEIYQLYHYYVGTK